METKTTASALRSIVQDLHEFWPDGWHSGDVSEICERAAAEIERLCDVIRTVVVNIERGSPPEAVVAWAKGQIANFEPGDAAEMRAERVSG